MNILSAMQSKKLVSSINFTTVKRTVQRKGTYGTAKTKGNASSRKDAKTKNAGKIGNSHQSSIPDTDTIIFFTVKKVVVSLTGKQTLSCFFSLLLHRLFLFEDANRINSEFQVTIYKGKKVN
ncbi:hypothetical protein V6Z12_A11G300000 [Gossypium hirsutum]